MASGRISQCFLVALVLFSGLLAAVGADGASEQIPPNSPAVAEANSTTARIEQLPGGRLC